MFTNIYYDRRSGNMHLREAHNGKLVKVSEKNEFYFYHEDKKKISPIKDAFGMPVVKKTFSNWHSMKDAKERIKHMGMKICESDLREEMKFLQNRFQGVNMEVDMGLVNICYMDIEIAGELEFPEPREAKYPINLITVKDSKTGQYNTFGLDKYTGKGIKNLTYRYYSNEKDMLIAFIKWFRKQRFDVITGWNVRDFDIHYIVNRSRRLDISLSLSPFNKELEVEVNEDDRGGFNAEEGFNISGNSKCYDLPGINILDYMELYKNFTFDTKERYSLQFIGYEELKEGKLELDGQINHIYKTNWNQFVDYNIQDVVLVEKLDNKLRFIELAYILAHQSLIPIERVFSSIAIWDGFIMNDLRKENKVMPDREHLEDWYIKEKHHVLPDGSMVNLSEKIQESKTPNYVEENYVKGGYVEAHPGFYKWVISRDFASLYPHIIMQFNISPECLVVLPSRQEIKDKNLIKSTMPGIYYLPHETRTGVMTKIVRKVYQERVDFKDQMYAARDRGDKAMEAYYKSQQHIRKILLNSLYGVSCNAGFHFFNLENARSITRGGRVLIRHVSKMANEYFASDDWNLRDRFEFFPNGQKDYVLKNKLVTLIDTDSNYLRVDELMIQNAPDAEPLSFCLEFNDKVFDPFFEMCLEIYAEEHNAPQVHNFEIETILDKQLVQAKKKYLKSIKWEEGKIHENPKIKATGIEIKKSDTPPFCREHLTNVVSYIFDEMSEEEITNKIINIKTEFTKQTIEDIGTNKSVNGYKKYASSTSTYLKDGLFYVSKTPAHVRAAINHNFMVKKLNLPVFEIQNGTKAKYIYIKSRNILAQYGATPKQANAVAFVGTFPEEFKDYFEIDYDTQFEKTFLNIVQRLYTAIGWGEISLKKTKIKKFIN
jgi:DNA polymerase elongation subunit (family B)